MSKIKKCECGSKEFVLAEELLWVGTIDEDGDLMLKNSDNAIKEIICANCEKKYNSEDFKSLNFN